MRAIHQLVQPARAIEERVLRVEVKMNKIGMRHGVTLIAGRGLGQWMIVHTGFTICVRNCTPGKTSRSQIPRAESELQSQQAERTGRRSQLECSCEEAPERARSLVWLA